MAFGTLNLIERPFDKSLLGDNYKFSTYEKFVQDFNKILNIHNELIIDRLRTKEYLHTIENLFDDKQSLYNAVSLQFSKKWFEKSPDILRVRSIIVQCLKIDIDLIRSNKENYLILDEKHFHLRFGDNGQISDVSRTYKTLDKSQYPYGDKISFQNNT